MDRPPRRHDLLNRVATNEDKRAAPSVAAPEPAATALDELGVRRTPTGHLFTLFAPLAGSVELGLNIHESFTPITELFALQQVAGPGEAKSCWAREVGGLPDEFEYVYRIDGGPELLDPYARLLRGGERWSDRSWRSRGLSFRPYRALWSARKSRTSGIGRPPRPTVAEETRVIYELHLRGFTRHPSSGVEHPGTYLGLIEKIPYLKGLGVTTVELLPIFEFDETENSRRNPLTGEELLNYWGYSPISFFAPKRSYAADSAPGAEIDELMLLVDECHRAGIEVVLDVVYNHTAEGGGGAGDPLRSFRGLAEDTYYIRDAESGRPFDCTGCGNTVNTNHPVVRRMIVDSLRYWAGEIGVDGFRFDLASAFYRGLRGEKLDSSPIVDEISTDPVLRDLLLIAEPWDVTGFSPPGGFPAPWREWNGAFRDDTRRYLRGDEVAPRRLALRVGGSPDLFAPPKRMGIDFVTCHDGFTIADLMSYDGKHNEENGEGGRDGSNFHLSWNHGVEGPTDDPAIVELRARQIRNALALLLFTRATPMLLAGDERGRTQCGNNNAWCQDNEISWVDWMTDGADGSIALVRRLVELRRELTPATLARFAELLAFESTTPWPPRIGAEAAVILFRDDEGETVSDASPELLLALNPTDRPVRLPVLRATHRRPWSLAVDTGRAATECVPPPDARPQLATDTVEMELPPRSMRLLLAPG